MDMSIIEANPDITREEYDKIVSNNALKQSIRLTQEYLVTRNNKFNIAAYDYMLYILYQPHYR